MADTPALDALLAKVDESAGTALVEYAVLMSSAAPRLAAIVRVLVEALNRAKDDIDDHQWAHGHSGIATALARADALAKGD